jgi:hypothetical protein
VSRKGPHHELSLSVAAGRPASALPTLDEAGNPPEGPAGVAVNGFSLWLSRLVLLLAAVLLTMIGLKFILEPVAAAGASGIILSSPLAHTNMRASFGAFPLAGGLIALGSLVSTRRHGAGLSVVAITIGTALAVRIFGVLVDGTFESSSTVLTAETALFALCCAALLVRRASAQRQPDEPFQNGGFR